jgi:hypothetical protein
MQQKILGITLSILGITGLIMAIMGINGPLVNEHLALLMAGGSAGAVAFFIGIWLFGRSGVPVNKVAGMSLMGLKEGKAALLRMKEEGVAALIRVKERRTTQLKEGQVIVAP